MSDDPVRRATAGIVEFYEKLSSWEHEVVRGKGLTLPQMHAIEILGESGDLRMKELAGKMGVTTGTLTVQVDRLEKRGFVERRPHETDRRSILVGLTEAGREKARDHHGLHLDLTRDITSGMSAKEIESLASALESMNQRF